MDWVFDHIAQLYQIGLAAVGVIGFAAYLRSELMNLRSRMEQIQKSQEILMDSLKQLNSILTQIAVQDARINMLEKDIDELRHHKGFID